MRAMADVFEMVFQEHRSFAFAEAAHCPGCSRVTDDTVPTLGGAFEEPPFDVCETLDGCVLASHEFRLLAGDVAGVRFEPVPDVVGWTALRVDPVVRIDPFASKVRWGTPCDRCGEPRYSMRDGPIRFAEGATVPGGFSCTDLGFGDTADFGPGQPVRIRPSILVDAATRKLLRSGDLLGLHFIAQP